MAIYRGAGGAGDATNDATSQAIIAVQAAEDAEGSKIAAAASAVSAASSASAAATSATNAASSATEASGFADDASDSADAAAAALDAFTDLYLGAKTTDPTLDNDGNALQTGALYFNTIANEFRVWVGTYWQVIVVGAIGDSVILQQFSGDGVETDFTLSTVPFSENVVFVFINGVYQQKTGYSISGLTLSFSEAPPLGTDNIEIAMITMADLSSLTAGIINLEDLADYYESSNVEGALQEVGRKLSETVSVKDFGAVGDGVTDDTTAIQAAITAAGYGGTVYFPKGVYKVTSTINLPAVAGSQSGVTLVGEGPSTIIKLGVSGLTNLFYVTGTNTTFQSLTLDTTSFSTTNGIHINYLENAGTGCNVNNCTIIGFISGILSKGLNHVYENNFFLNNTTHINSADDCRNSSMSKNHMLGGSTGIKLYQTTTQAEGVRISDNTILVTGGNGAGIDIQAGLEIVMYGNIIDQIGANSVGIYIHPTGSMGAGSIKMIGNWIAAGEGSYGVFASGNNGHLNFTNNTINSNNNLQTKSGIALIDTNAYQIIGNRFLMNLQAGEFDISINGAVNGTVLGNDSSISGSPALLNKFNSQVETASSFYADAYVYAQAYNLGLTGPNITYGGLAPTTTQPQGSLYLRTGGSVGNRLYISQGGGSWLAVAGV